MVLATLPSKSPGDFPSCARGRVLLRRAVFASIVGNALEWYDFFLFGTAAALVFGELFFPIGGDASIHTLASFGGYAVGFLARPLGGLVFGHIGDRRGRKTALVWTLTIMGAATFSMGLLPTYRQVGAWSPILLVALRLLQGVAAGGEWSGGVLIITESAPPGRRGFLGAWSQTGVGLGFVLAAMAFGWVGLLPAQDVTSWGWRIPFLSSAAIFVAGTAIRIGIPESAEFAAAEMRTAVSRTPLTELLRRHPRELWKAVGARLAEMGGAHLVTTFSLAYGAFVHAPPRIMLLGVVLAMAADSAMMPVFGALSDLIGRKRVYLAGILAMAMFGYPFFLMIGTGSPTVILIAMLFGGGLCHSAMIGVQPVLFTEMFTTEVRYSGLAVAHEVSSIIVGVAPLIATALFIHYRSPFPVAVYLGALCALSFFSVLTIKRPSET